MARQCADATNKQVQARNDKLGQHVIQTSVYIGRRYITGEIRIGFKRAFHLILRRGRNKLFKRSIETGDAFSCCYRDAVAVGGRGLEFLVR